MIQAFDAVRICTLVSQMRTALQGDLSTPVRSVPSIAKLCYSWSCFELTIAVDGHGLVLSGISCPSASQELLMAVRLRRATFNHAVTDSWWTHCWKQGERGGMSNFMLASYSDTRSRILVRHGSRGAGRTRRSLTLNVRTFKLHIAREPTKTLRVGTPLKRCWCDPLYCM